MDSTTLFDITDINDALVDSILDDVCSALLEKGYNPVNQIVGYLITNDETYITNYKNARNQLLSIDRAKILETIVRRYLSN
ncbi:MAG: IreB family regulatory phosphoprotein [Bacilli bacterium]|nr:IreB family regulatory phosphoprotein [Bacilli bacterium]